jgi:hypothetical protein
MNTTQTKNVKLSKKEIEFQDEVIAKGEHGNQKLENFYHLVHYYQV